MKFQYNRAIDACSALFCYATWERQSDLMRSRGMVWPEDLLTWKTHCDEHLPGVLKPLLTDLVSEFMLLFFSLLKLVVSCRIKTVDQLLTCWNQLDDRQLVELAIRGESFNMSAEELQAHPEGGVGEILTADGTTRPGEEEKFHDFLCHPGTYKKTIAILISEFYHTALRYQEEEIASKMEERIAGDGRLFRDNPGEFSMKHLKMSTSEPGNQGADSETCCFISWYNSWDVVSQSEPSFIVYGRNSHMHNEGVGTEDVYNLLGDETRRGIIKLLSSRKMYTRELATELGITSATVSHHMSRLFGLGLIYEEPGERKRIYHCLKKERLNQMFALLRGELIDN